MTVPDAHDALHDTRTRLLDAARHPGGVCVMTGAGMSAESGIPTFRDARTGLWSRHDPMALGTEQGFRADPTLVWDWFEHRRQGVLAAEPNAGHLALADFSHRHPGGVTVVTQNVDDLHQRSGIDRTIRLHGDILRHRWLDACPLDPPCPTSDARPGRPPHCAECGNRLRPDVVWFGEPLPAHALEAATEAARRCRVALVIGTSGAVWPAAGLAQLAREAGARVVILNPQPSEIDDQAHVLLRGTAAAVLPALLAA